MERHVLEAREAGDFDRALQLCTELIAREFGRPTQNVALVQSLFSQLEELQTIRDSIHHHHHTRGRAPPPPPAGEASPVHRPQEPAALWGGGARLPEGWQERVTADGERFFVDTVAKRTTWEDPRRRPPTRALSEERDRALGQQRQQRPPRAPSDSALAREAAPMFMGSTNGSAAQGGAGMGTVFDRELLAAYVLGADGGSEDGSEAEGLELDGGDWGLPQEAALGPLPAIDWLLKVVVQGATTRVPFPLQNAHRFHQACSCAENVCRFLLVSCPGPEDG